MNKHIVISKGPELLRVPTDCLMYVEAQGNYSNVVTQDGKQHLVSFQLGAIEDLIAEQLEETPLVRLGRSLIINTDFIYLIAGGTKKSKGMRHYKMSEMFMVGEATALAMRTNVKR